MVAVEILREHLRESRVPEAQIAAGMAQWTLSPIHIGGQVAAVILQRGSEVHVVAAPEFRDKGYMSRARIRKVLGDVLSEHGYVTTRIGKGDGTNRLFIDRLGFRPTWSDEQFTYFMLTELPFGKGT